VTEGVQELIKSATSKKGGKDATLELEILERSYNLLSKLMRNPAAVE